MKFKKYIFIFLSLIGLLAGCQTQEQHSHTLVFKENIKVEYDSSVNTASFITRVDTYPVSQFSIDKNIINVSNLKVICPKLTRNSVQKLGTVTLNYKIGDETYSHDIQIVDTKKPTIKMKQDHLTFEVGEMKDISKYFTVKDNYDKSRDIQVKVNGIKNLKIKKEGTYKLTIVATDTSGNTSKKKVTITIKDSKREEEERKKAEEEQAKKEQEEKEKAEAEQKAQQQSQTSNNSSSSSTSSNSYQSYSNSSQSSQSSSSVPSTQDFLFSQGYDMSSAPSACESALNSSGRSGACTPIQDSDGIYLGMRLSLY